MKYSQFQKQHKRYYKNSRKCCLWLPYARTKLTDGHTDKQTNILALIIIYRKEGRKEGRKEAGRRCKILNCFPLCPFPPLSSPLVDGWTDRPYSKNIRDTLAELLLLYRRYPYFFIVYFLIKLFVCPPRLPGCLPPVPGRHGRRFPPQPVKPGIYKQNEKNEQ